MAKITTPLLLVGLLLLGATGFMLASSDSPAMPVANAKLPTLVGHPTIAIPECPYYSLFFVTRDWKSDPEQAQLVEWFRSNPRLVALRQQTIVQKIMPTDPIYRAKSATTGRTFAGVTGGVFPTYILQTCNGDKRFKISRENMPATADELADQIQAAIDNRFASDDQISAARAPGGPIRNLLNRRRCDNDQCEPRPVESGPLEMAEEFRSPPMIPDTVARAVDAFSHIDDKIVQFIAGGAILLALAVGGLVLVGSYGRSFTSKHPLS